MHQTLISPPYPVLGGNRYELANYGSNEGTDAGGEDYNSIVIIFAFWYSLKVGCVRACVSARARACVCAIERDGGGEPPGAHRRSVSQSS